MIYKRMGVYIHTYIFPPTLCPTAPPAAGKEERGGLAKGRSGGTAEPAWSHATLSALRAAPPSFVSVDPSSAHPLRSLLVKQVRILEIDRVAVAVARHVGALFAVRRRPGHHGPAEEPVMIPGHH